jgi:hypothetical protein
MIEILGNIFIALLVVIGLITSVLILTGEIDITTG